MGYPNKPIIDLRFKFSVIAVLAYQCTDGFRRR
jgi:hypothetical protein